MDAFSPSHFLALFFIKRIISYSKTQLVKPRTAFRAVQFVSPAQKTVCINAESGTHTAHNGAAKICS